MRILFSHVNFPSQFRRISKYFSSLGHDVIFVAQNAEWHAPAESSFTISPYLPPPDSDYSYLHPYLRRFNKAISQGQAVFRHCESIKLSGWDPDVVISHVGFGNGLFLKDLFPNSFRIGLVEWFYNSSSSDVDFLPPYSVSEDHKLRLRAWNAETLVECSSLDSIVTPTNWQCSQFPFFLRNNINVIHEGIDINVDCSRISLSTFYQKLKTLTRGSDKILTYVSRCFEEYRGYPQFIETLSLLQRIHPDMHVLIVGTDCTAYGSPRSDGISWSDWSKNRTDLDFTRIHWLGSLQTDDYHCVLHISTVHFYLTVPFILSWSLLEAMSFGCSIVASDTPPVREVITHESEGLLVDFFDTQSHAESISLLLTDPTLRSRLSGSARIKAESYSSERGLSAWKALLPGQLVDC